MEEVTLGGEMFTTGEARIVPMDNEARWMAATRGHQTAAGPGTDLSHPPGSQTLPSCLAVSAGSTCLFTILQPVFFLIEFCGTFLAHNNGGRSFNTGRASVRNKACKTGLGTVGSQ